MRNKLAPHQIAEARKLRDSNCKFWTYAELGKRFGINPVTVYYAVNPSRRSKKFEDEVIPQTIDPGLLSGLLRAIPADTNNITELPPHRIASSRRHHPQRYGITERVGHPIRAVR